VGQREVDDRALVDLFTLFCQYAALPEGARHIDLLTEVVHRPLEQFELIHVEFLLLLASSLGIHAPARSSRRDGVDVHEYEVGTRTPHIAGRPS
jgi:hypothetical protein